MLVGLGIGALVVLVFLGVYMREGGAWVESLVGASGDVTSVTIIEFAGVDRPRRPHWILERENERESHHPRAAPLEARATWCTVRDP